MTTRSERERLVTELWQEHLRAPFPDRLREADVAGVSMVLLDADLAGCVSVWRSAGGTKDDGRLRILERRLGDLDQVLDLLGDPDEATYCRRLGRLARLVAGATGAGG
ncbi:hypothetical protein LQ51_14810 [Micromonospora sp. HK10]|nr:hypothetical protein LQ51_14810 [Micromonospora sp. HK10]